MFAVYLKLIPELESSGDPQADFPSSFAFAESEDFNGLLRDLSCDEGAAERFDLIDGSHVSAAVYFEEMDEAMTLASSISTDAVEVQVLC